MASAALAAPLPMPAGPRCGPSAEIIAKLEGFDERVVRAEAMPDGWVVEIWVGPATGTIVMVGPIGEPACVMGVIKHTGKRS